MIRIAIVRSVKYTVEQYGGHLNTGVRDGWFRLEIIIPKEYNTDSRKAFSLLFPFLPPAVRRRVSALRRISSPGSAKQERKAADRETGGAWEKRVLK